MPSIQVKGVPEGVHEVLSKRARAVGQSLQQYLLARLIEEATSPTLEEVLDRIEHRSGGKASLRASTSAVRSERDRK